METIDYSQTFFFGKNIIIWVDSLKWLIVSLYIYFKITDDNQRIVICHSKYLLSMLTTAPKIS